MDETETRPDAGAALKRWLPLAVLIVLAGVVYLTGLHRYLTFQMLAEHREMLLAKVAEWGFMAPLLFICIYIVVAALSIPGATYMTLFGGFLFGTLLGTVYNLVGATLGATIVFLSARSAFGDLLQRRAGPFLKRVEGGFRADAVSYLLVLRLVPLFPFWLVNLVPGLFGMSLSAYVLCTFFGMMPGSLVYTSVGAGLGKILDSGQMPDFWIVFEPHILVPLVALGLLALVPVVYKRWKRPA